MSDDTFTCSGCKKRYPTRERCLSDGGKIHCSTCAEDIRSGALTIKVKVLESRLKHLEKKVDILSDAFIAWKKKHDDLGE